MDDMPDDPGVITNEIDNLALYTYPMPALPNGDVMFLLGIAADPKHVGSVDIQAALPETFGGKHTAHFLKFDGALLQSFKPEYMEGISHLALLTGGEQMADVMYFGDDIINQQGVILWYSETLQKFYFVHCRSCAFMIASYLTKEQETWQKIAKASKLTPASSVLN